MHPYRIAAVAATVAGLGALTLVLLAGWGGVRIDGFSGFYSPTVQETVGISVLFLAGFLLHIAARLSAVENSIRATHAPVGAADRDPFPVPEDVASVIRAEASPGSGQAANPLIRLSHVEKVYRLGPVEVHALRGATLDLPSGTLTVVLGPSGSGKTTLLNLLGGIDRATSGTILFDGTDITKLDEREIVGYRRERVGFVFQFFNLIPSLTARENVALAGELVASGADVEGVLRAVGLGNRMDHFPAELSGGEQQRVAIARALVKNPPFLLCDEPTGELDYATGVRILEILRRAAHSDGRAVIVVTHNAAIAEMADQVVRLRGGLVDAVVRNPEPVPPASLRW